jgi:two-component system, response regulator, stage 0 sporulation protein A
MNERISILIADDNIEFGDLLNDYINQEVDLQVVGIARDGLNALEMIKALEPDVVILDIIMPNLDGIGVLEKIAQVHLNKKPLFLMLTAIGQDVFIQRAMLLGAEYYIVKPFDVGVLVSRIRQMYKEKRFSSFNQNISVPKAEQPYVLRLEHVMNLEVEVTNLMHEVGIPPHMSGYQFIREAIIQTVNNSKLFNSITKVLYPKVAEHFGTTPQKVERAIRNAIESAWERGNPDSIDSLFGYTINYSKGKPTNSEFIAMMADKVRVYYGSLK